MHYRSVIPSAVEGSAPSPACLIPGAKDSAAIGLESIGFERVGASDLRAGPDGPIGERGRVEATGDGGVSVAFPSGCRLRVDVRARTDALVVGRLTVTACTREQPFIILVRLCLANRAPPYFMIPGVLYGTNNANRGPMNPAPDGYGPDIYGGDPKLDYRAPGPDRLRRASPSWHVRADRSSVPSVSAAFGGRFIALGIREASTHTGGDWVYNGVGLWTNAERGDSLSITMGSLDWPARIVRFQLQDAPHVEPLPGLRAIGMTTEFCIYASPAPDRFAYEPFLAAWYGHLHTAPRTGAPLRQAIRDVAGALSTDGIDPRTGYFHMLRTDTQIVDTPVPIAWAGILQIARPLMAAGRLLNDPALTSQARGMADRAVREAYNPASGFFFDMQEAGLWQRDRWWPELEHAAVINGHACLLLLRMAEENPAEVVWAEQARRVLQRVLPGQRADGRLPAGFTAGAGLPVTCAGFGGCCFVAPLFMLARLYGDRAAGKAARRALEHYWEEFTALESVGLNLDCRGAVDSGTGHVLAKALVEAHRVEGNPRDLARLRHALHYVYSYQFGHNTRHRHPVCEWSSSGAQVTSTHNVHLDGYGGEMREESQYAIEHTQDPYLAARAADSLAWARQAYNRTAGEYGFGRVGWVAEQFYHTYDRYAWTMTPWPEGDGTVWAAYFPWTAGALLSAFQWEAERSGL